MSPPVAKELSELLALLAHDLRNPLAALLANVNFLRASIRERSPEVREALSDSALSCTALGQFLGNLDVVGRSLLEVKPVLAAVGLGQLVGEAVARLGAQDGGSGVEVQIVDGGSSPRVMADPRWLNRAVDNLLANALQYAPPRSTVSVQFGVRIDRGFLVILDDGPLVSSELRDWVFSASAQAQAKQRFDARYGRGLGLYCAAEAARLAGAEVSLADRAGRSMLELSARLSP